jgi:hypothetical protein
MPMRIDIRQDLDEPTLVQAPARTSDKTGHATHRPLTRSFVRYRASRPAGSNPSIAGSR